MRRTLLAAFTVCVWLLPAVAPAQNRNAEAERANRAYRLGWESMRAEAWAEAAKQFQEAITIDPKFTLAWYSLGRAQMALKQFSAAIGTYEKCQDLYLNVAQDHFSGQMDAIRARDELIQQYKEGIRQATATTGNPSQSQSQYVQQLRNTLRDLENAQQRNVSVDVTPQVPFFVSLSLGSAYFRVERFDAAERAYKAAIESNPQSGESHNNLAVVYMLTNRLDLAEAEVKEAEKVGYNVSPQFKADLKAKQR
jgi:tetratricopeptide (TPR) repeat protein